MTAKADRFIIALRRLCREHNVMLSVSDYDRLQVWDLRPGEEELHAAGIEDKTQEGKKK